MFNHVQNSSIMNKEQATMWDNPRFRNWIAVARACHVVQQELGRRLKPLDLKTPHMEILLNLLRREGISQQELAARLLVGRSNMTMLLPQLEKRGLVERRPDPGDRRALRLFLTNEGKALAGRAVAIQTELVDEVMSLSSPEECDMVGNIMRRMTAHMLDSQSASDNTEEGAAS